MFLSRCVNFKIMYSLLRFEVCLLGSVDKIKIHLLKEFLSRHMLE